MYSSPSSRISLGKCFRCARSSLLYSGTGGKRASGAGLKPFAVPAEVGVAMRSRGMNFILSVSTCLEVEQINLGESCRL